MKPYGTPDRDRTRVSIELLQPLEVFLQSHRGARSEATQLKLLKL